MHPKYGGWFAFRAVIIFPDIRVPSLEQTQPPDVLPEEKDRVELLEKFNGDWRTGEWRDVYKCDAKYSEEQHKYFITPPKDRLKLLEEIKTS